MNERVIFCVDDEDMILKSLKRELKNAFQEGFLIETSGSGKDALELFEELLVEQHEIPVIISDHIMPDMKGDELLQRIHSLSPNTLKIMLTGQADLHAVANAVNYANLYRYISKPWESTDLILTVKEAIRRYDQEKQLAEQNAVLHNMNAILEQQVKERTAALEAANASKDKFFSILAHDLRAPFNGLIGLTQLFAENIEEYTYNDIKNGMNALQKTARTVFELLENLLTWSRLQRGIMEYFPQEFSLTNLILNALDLFEVNATNKHVTLRSDVTTPIMVYGDANMVNTVLRNLISNALKFTPTGGAITVSAVERAEHVELSVTDSGIGMASFDLEKLFRIDVKMTRPGTAGEKGSGLGLILCKELVEYNQGSIWVESQLGKGTTFRFTIPKPPF